MRELATSFGEWLLSVLDHWEVIVTTGVIAFFIDLADRFWEWKMPKKSYVIFVAIGFFLATFAAWREESEKVKIKETIMEIQPNASYVPRLTGPLFGQRMNVDFGIQNVGQYMANHEYSFQTAEIHDAAHPYDFQEQGLDKDFPTSEQVENEVFDQFQKHRASNPALRSLLIQSNPFGSQLTMVLRWSNQTSTGWLPAPNFCTS